MESTMELNIEQVSKYVKHVSAEQTVVGVRCRKGRGFSSIKRRNTCFHSSLYADSYHETEYRPNTLVF